MSVVNLDALARAFGVTTDGALADELRVLLIRCEGVIEEATNLGRYGSEVPGFAEAVQSAAGWLDEAYGTVDKALAACEDHQRGIG